MSNPKILHNYTMMPFFIIGFSAFAAGFLWLLSPQPWLFDEPANILLLDEPFAALDILTIKMLQEIIVNLQSMERITVVVCDHQARDLLSCVDRAIVLSNGKIIASGSPNEIINDTNARSAYFGDEFKIN